MLAGQVKLTAAGGNVPESGNRREVNPDIAGVTESQREGRRLTGVQRGYAGRYQIGVAVERSVAVREGNAGSENCEDDINGTRDW